MEQFGCCHKHVGGSQACLSRVGCIFGHRCSLCYYRDDAAIGGNRSRCFCEWGYCFCHIYPGVAVPQDSVPVMFVDIELVETAVSFIYSLVAEMVEV